jgi:hypothetical protein
MLAIDQQLLLAQGAGEHPQPLVVGQQQLEAAGLHHGQLVPQPDQLPVVALTPSGRRRRRPR